MDAADLGMRENYAESLSETVAVSQTLPPDVTALFHDPMQQKRAAVLPEDPPYPD